MDLFSSFVDVFFTLFFFCFLRRCHQKPCAKKGGRELFWLCVGTVGFFLTGPCKAIIPIPALIIYHWLAWIAAAFLYFLVFWLVGQWLLGYARSIEIYQVSPLAARKLFHRFALTLDSGAKFAGDTVFLPVSKTSLRLKLSPLSRHATIQVRGREWRSVMERDHTFLLNQFLQKGTRKSSLVSGIWSGIFFLNLLYLVVTVVQNYGTLMIGLVHFLLT